MKNISQFIKEAVDNSSDVINQYKEFAVSADEFLTGKDLSRVIPNNCIKDVEKFLGKKSKDWLVFTEGHFGMENSEAYNALFDMTYDTKFSKRKHYEYVATGEDNEDVYDDFDFDFTMEFYNVNGLKFVYSGGSGDDYCCIA